MDDLSGQTIKGYELRAHLGAGGFGAVYSAYQTVVEREVAIKVILPQFANQPDFVRRFEAEARMVARLEHPHIVPLYDYWRDPDGAYIVMRYLRGGSLQDRLRSGGRLSVEATLSVIEQLGPALMVAHRNGIVHRDLKPPNVMLDEDGNAYLSDFGISKDLGADRTAEGERGIVGSPAYLSPEQITGGEITPAADIYSLGVMIYEMLTGSHPYAADGATMSELIARHLSVPLPNLDEMAADLPAAIDAVLQCATAKDPSERYPDAVSVVKALRQAGAAVAAQPSAPTPAGDDDMLVIIDPGVTRDSLQNLVISEAMITFRNPYKGLRAFEEGDAGDFFGRTALIKQLLARMAEPHPLTRFLAVVGASGSGKSSAVKAGLVPALRAGKIPGSDQWYFAEIVPGANPLVELENALLSVATRPPAGLTAQLRSDEHGLVWAVDRILGDEAGDLLLVIDQFEELFTATVDADEREQFLDLLRIAATDPESRLRIVITLRADFTDRPLQYVAFGDILRQRIEFVLPMTPAELEQSIAGPAERVGVKVEPDLLAAIMADLSDEPGALPLLQYALTELFEQRKGATLTRAGYQQIGGVLGALAQRAEDIFCAQEPALQTALQQVCLRLVTLGEGTEDTRRRVRQSELAAVVDDHDLLQAALDTFGKPRLLTFDRDPVSREPTVEVAHEALIREWDRLRAWLDESRDDIRLQRRLAAGAAEWQAAQSDTSYLLSGAQLAQFASWATDTSVALTAGEQAYLAASTAERDRLAALEQERQQHELRLQRRSVRLSRTLTGVMAAFLVVGVLLALWALGERSTAQDAEDKANQGATSAYNARITAEAAQGNAEIGATEVALHVTQEFVARATSDRRSEESQSLALAAQAQQLDSSDQILALALALEANTINDPPQIAPRTLGRMAIETRYQRVLLYPEAAEGISALAISPDGRFIASGSYDRLIQLWDFSSGELLQTLAGHENTIMGLAFSPDSQTLISGSTDNTINVWDVTQPGRQIDTLGEQEPNWLFGGIQEVRFSPDGQLIASTDDDGVKLWNAQAYTLLDSPLDDAYGDAYGLSFSPDGRFLAVGFDDGTIRLWNVQTRDLLLTLEGHTNVVTSVQFHPDDQLLLSGSWDGTVKLWDWEMGEELFTIDEAISINYVAFNPDGETFVFAAGDEINLWDTSHRREMASFDEIHTGGVEIVEFSPDGMYLVSGAGDKTVKISRLSPILLHTLDDMSSSVSSIAISPDGRYIAAVGDGGIWSYWITMWCGYEPDSSVKVWDAQTGDLVYSFDDHTGLVNHVVFSPDGQLLVFVSQDKTVRVWDMQTREVLHTLSRPDQISTVVFSPDGQILAVAGGQNISLLHVESGELQHIDHTAAVQIATFSPDGQTLAFCSRDMTIKLWDVASDTLRLSLEGHTAQVQNVVFSLDGRQVISGAADGMVLVWDVKTGELLSELDSDLEVYQVAVSPDAKTIAMWADKITLWDIVSDEQLYVFENYYNSSTGEIVALSPDGLLLAYATAEKTIQIRDVQTGELVFSSEKHPESISGIKFSPDGQRLISGALDGWVRVWDVSWIADPVQWTLANQYVRELTCAERERFLIEPYCEPGQDVFPTRTPIPTPALTD